MKPIVTVEEFPESPDQNVIYIKLSTREILFYTPLGFTNFSASLPAPEDLFLDTSVTVVGASGEADTAESSDNSRLHNGDGYFLDSDVGRQIVGIGTGGGQTFRGLVDGQNYTISEVYEPISGTSYYGKARIANPSNVDGSGAGNGILLWKHRENERTNPFWGFVYSE
tara:strand:- start:8696 stop:9199 length:504 start_codon:yes stop_codon:yes gene_type:complete